jgi:hypothetical protein
LGKQPGGTFFMRKFLFLRVLAISNLVITMSCMALTLSTWNTFSARGQLPSIFIGLAMLLPLALNSFFILYLFWKHYPDTEVPKPLRVGYRIVDVLCWIIVVILLLGPLLLLLESGEKTTGDYIGSAFCLFFGIFMIAQLVLGGRLLRSIVQNARLALENSFI